MQADLIPQWLDLGLHGFFAAVALYLLGAAKRLYDHVHADEAIKKEYPPHRHINGTRIVYPKEYQPAPIERLEN